MHNNDRFYTFLLSHSSKTQINNSRRVQVPKRFVHGSIVGLFLLVGFSAFGVGINGVLSDASISGMESNAGLLTRVSGQVPMGDQKIDYSRPEASDSLAPNAGGPALSISLDGENSELEGQLRGLVAKADPAYIPSAWAHLGKINNEFGFRRNPFGGRTYEFHPGMDIDGERGDLVIAPANGTIIKAGWQGGYGNMVEIDHGNGLTTRYGHLSRIDVAIGDPVIRGQLLGLVGSTGRSTGPHLHYEMRLNDRPINPRHFLPPEPTELVKQNG
jgi:murein DD-endopeptidase MepM/ murein hydrolase activator NlpD